MTDRFTYPPARRDEVVDDYHGTLVADPYRWLEDPHGDDTRAFVAAQNGVTLPYLSGLPERAALAERMRATWNVPRTSAPVARSGVKVWSHNDGLADQPSIMVEDADGERRVLIDPNTMSDDGAIAITQVSLSPDGALLAYNVAEAGSDWQVIRCVRTADGSPLPDEIRHVKFSQVTWHGDGFFYSRFPAVDPTSTETVRNQTVWYHTLGTDQSDDRLVFENADDPDPGYVTAKTPDERYLLLIEWVGTSRANGVLYRPLDDDTSDWVRLVEPGVGQHLVLAHDDGAFIVHTDVDAPNGRIVRIPLDDPTGSVDVVAEEAHPIAAAGAAAGGLWIMSLEEASHRIRLTGLDGAARGAIELSEPGTVSEVNGRFSDPDVYIGFESFLRPPSALRWRDGDAELFAGAELPPSAAGITVERDRAVSSDGVEVGMFVLRHREAALPAPVELYGYGGFTVDLTPMFSPARLAFLEAGGVVVSTNLRGGAELGEEWHVQGMLGNKQQVFDDFAACAERIIDRGIATAETLAIRGGSNGGLLTAAVMLQRPELFGAVVSQVPVADMLRYQLFTAGRYWTVEYGDAIEDADAFQWLIRYSPYHRAMDVDAASLPPLLITTAETDDRVVPMHALKLAAALQHSAGGSSEQPLLVRVETRAGHGMGKPTSKLIEESADIFGVILHHCRPE
jgi:prolyl oligopeptidase